MSGSLRSQADYDEASRRGDNAFVPPRFGALRTEAPKARWSSAPHGAEVCEKGEFSPGKGGIHSVPRDRRRIPNYVGSALPR
jgi:hypothetical protein